jgi:hypothetical protein
MQDVRTRTKVGYDASAGGNWPSDRDSSAMAPHVKGIHGDVHLLQQRKQGTRGLQINDVAPLVQLAILLLDLHAQSCVRAADVSAEQHTRCLQRAPPQER